MSPIAARFSLAIVHEIYCGILYARHNSSSILRRTTAAGQMTRCNSPILLALSLDIAACQWPAAICTPFCSGLDRRNGPLNFPAPKFSSIFFAFPLKDKMVNYTRLTWKLAYMLTYRTCNPTVGFSKYESDNKLLVGVTFCRVALGVT